MIAVVPPYDPTDLSAFLVVAFFGFVLLAVTAIIEHIWPETKGDR